MFPRSDGCLAPAAILTSMPAAHSYIIAMKDRAVLNRRNLILSGAALATGVLATSAQRLLRDAPASDPKLQVPAPPAKASARPGSLKPDLFGRALGALDTHAGTIKHRDRLAIVDFSAASSEPRFHFLDVESGRVAQLLVAHGSGSDPHHTGYLEHFSNVADSNASSEGAFVTTDYYVGKHGRSQRLRGLDPTNSNAFDRAIVVHGAWYANADMLRSHGKLGRSQGCFAVGESDLQAVFDHLGEGRLIFASRA